MEAPEKIWINPSVDLPKLNGVLDKDSVQYVRKDVFINNVCDGIEHLLSGYIIRNFNFGDSYEIDTLIEDIKKYMDEKQSNFVKNV